MKIVILNQKGGVGKTTITVNLSLGMAKAGKKTLLIDLDPQAHSTVIYVPEVCKDKTVNEIFRDKKYDIARVIQPAVVVREIDGEEKATKIENLSIIPSSIHLAALAETIISRTHREKILHNHIEKIKNKFDYVLIDCPPTLGVLTVNAIYTADLILIPTNYSKYSLDGISDLFNSISEVKEGGTYKYKILRSIKDLRSTRTNIVIEEALKNFKEHLFKTIIRRNEAINQAQMVGQPIFVFAPNSTGSEDFFSLTREIISYG